MLNMVLRVSKVQRYKEKIENKEHDKFKKLLEPYMSKSKDEKPFIFYFAPVNQDIDRMLDQNYKQCAYILPDNNGFQWSYI